VSTAPSSAPRVFAAVKASFLRTVETSRRVMEDLLGKGADKADLAEIIARTDALDHLRTDLMDSATLAPFEYHPGDSRSLVPDPQAEFHFGRSDRACRGDQSVRALIGVARAQLG
jgi:hypothetical protein